MKNNKLQRAISLALASAGMMTAFGNASAAQVYYNKFNADTLTISTVDGQQIDGSWEFTGLSAGVAPFGYTGSAPANWAVQLTTQHDSAIVSTANAFAATGFAADVDTAIGGWNDAKFTTGLFGGSAGWIHQADEALIKSDLTQYVTISLAGATKEAHGNYATPNTDWTFGMTIFEGMDTSTDFPYYYHNSWNEGYCPASAPECTTPTVGNVTATPVGSQGLTFKTFSDNSSVTFLAEAGMTYSVWLGGFNLGHFLTPVAEYQATITTSNVPIPMAGWLFGGSLLTLLSSLRRKYIRS